LAKFLDIFMVEYPEVWAKVESAILKRKNSMQPQDLIEIIKHFSNQGEGTEEFYDQVEKILEPSLSSMNAKQLVVCMGWLTFRVLYKVSLT
jgi:hypothetical protein